VGAAHRHPGTGAVASNIGRIDAIEAPGQACVRREPCGTPPGVPALRRVAAPGARPPGTSICCAWCRNMVAPDACLPGRCEGMPSVGDDQTTDWIAREAMPAVGAMPTRPAPDRDCAGGCDACLSNSKSRSEVAGQAWPGRHRPQQDQCSPSDRGGREPARSLLQGFHSQIGRGRSWHFSPPYRDRADSAAFRRQTATGSTGDIVAAGARSSARP